MRGRWEFYWSALHEPAAFRGPRAPRPTGYIRLPGLWTSYKDKKLPGQGYATYRLRVLLEQGTTSLTLKQMPVDTAYRLYVDGRLLARNGTVARTPEKSRPQWLPRIVHFTPGTDTVEIVLQVSNFELNAGGPFYSTYLGTPRGIQARRERGLLRDSVIFAALALFGVYHLVLFVLRTRERSFLFYGLACLGAALHAVTHGEKYLFELLPHMSWEFLQKLNVGGGYIVLPLWIAFLREAYRRFFHKWIVVGILAVCAAVLLVVIFAPARIHFQTGLPYYRWTIAVYIYAAAMLAWAVYRNTPSAGIMLTGVLIILVTIFHDYLFEQGFVQGVPWYATGIFIFLSVQSVAIARRFSRAFRDVEILSGELETRNRDLTRLDKLKDDFLANTSHELRTPLNGIIGITESVLQGVTGPLSAGTHDNLRLVASSGRRLASLINDILDFSKLRHGDIVLRRNAVDISSVIDVVLALSRPLVGDKQLELIHERNVMPSADADEDRLEQILHNLVGNAVKFTRAGKVVVSARMASVPDPSAASAQAAPENGRDPSPGEMLEITVADTGIGIPPEKQELIFQSFTQADGSIAREYSGTGLGLSVSKRLIELHGGTIRVESTPGQGSRFIFTIPPARADQPASHDENRLVRGLVNEETLAAVIETAAEDESSRPLTRESENEDQTYEETTGKTQALGEAPAEDAAEVDAPWLTPAEPMVETEFQVLVVDDDPVNRQVLKNHLSLHKYTVVEATGGKEALRLLEDEHSFDLILLDAMMPGLSGYDVMGILREKYSSSELPVIMLTAKNRVSDLLTSLDGGANDFLVKPFDPQELLARVKTMLTLKQAAKSQSDLAAIQSELNLAREIQQSLLPRETPEVSGLDIAVTYRSMENVGGDFYDFRPMDGGLGVLMADVSGHGVPAALIVSIVKIAFWLQKKSLPPPDELFDSMNSVLEGNIGNEFVTACYAFIDPETKVLRTSNAGHPPLLVWKKERSELLKLRPFGRLLGILPKGDFEFEEIPLDPGDRIIFYTDGVYEAPSPEGEQYTEARLQAFVGEHEDLDANAFTEHLVETVIEWCGGPDRINDDIALMVIDVHARN